jgi:hypothetical protein
MRIPILALLGCSFLTVQARTMQERTRAFAGNAHRLVTQPLNPNGQGSRVAGLGGGTTRALHETSDLLGAGALVAGSALRPPLATIVLRSRIGLRKVPLIEAPPPLLRI